MSTRYLVDSQGDCLPHLDRRTAELYARRLWRRIARLPETTPPQHLAWILGELALAHLQLDATERHLEILWQFAHPEPILEQLHRGRLVDAAAPAGAGTSRSGSTRFSKRRRTAAA